MVFLVVIDEDFYFVYGVKLTNDTFLTRNRLKTDIYESRIHYSSVVVNGFSKILITLETSMSIN